MHQIAHYNSRMFRDHELGPRSFDDVQ